MKFLLKFLSLYETYEFLAYTNDFTKFLQCSFHDNYFNTIHTELFLKPEFLVEENIKNKISKSNEAELLLQLRYIIRDKDFQPR